MKINLKELQVYSGIAILFVLIIHATAYYFTRGLGLPDDKAIFDGIGYLNRLIRNIVGIAVPIFIFVAGYKYHLGKHKVTSYKSFALKRLNKILLPFLSISLIFIVISNYANPQFVVGFAKDVIKILVGYNFAYQLWYVPMYLFIVLTYPMFLKVFKKRSLRLTIFIVLATIVVVLTFTNIVIQPIRLQPFNFIYYFYLYELGCIFCEYDSKIKKNIYLCTAVIYLVILTVIVMTDNFPAYIMLGKIMIPFGVITFFYISKLLKNSKALLFLGLYSFPIFLFHEPVFMRMTSELLLHIGVMNRFYSVIILIMSSLILSVVLSLVLRTVFNNQRFIFLKKRCGLAR